MINCSCGKKYNSYLKSPIHCPCGNILSFKETEKPNRQLLNFSEQVVENKTYQDLWRELHTYEYKSAKETEIWFRKWCQVIPCGSCKQDWYTYIGEFPPDFSSDNNFFEWTIKAHNWVNKKLNKPEFSLEEAYTIYKRV